MIGFLNVYKPPGPSSHDVVSAVRRRLPRPVKVGHCGTLDPFAEGVLVLCVGAATRLAEYVQRQPKRYLAEVALGASSTTDDPTGAITRFSPGRAPAPAPPAEEQVRAALAQFVGEVRQRPPAHSAVHVDGQRAYRLARRGQEVEVPERTVTVHAIDLIRYEYPLLEIDVRCGGGTYIRAIARDLGAALGSAAYCSRLVRTEVGVFRAEGAVRPDDLDPARHLLPPLLAMGGLPRASLSDADCARLRMGQCVRVSPAGVLPPDTAESGDLNTRVRLASQADGMPSAGFPGPSDSVECAVLDSRGDLVAVAEFARRERELRPRIVLPEG